MIPSGRRRDPLPKLLVQGVVVVFLLSTTHSQWLSYKNSRNPKSNLWFPNMPSPKTLQQRSSGTLIRGLESSSSSSNNNNTNLNNNNNVNSGSSVSSGLNANPESKHGQQRTRLIGHRSAPNIHVGQSTYQTVHGGVINRQESVNQHSRNNVYSSSSRLLNAQSNNNGHRQNQNQNQNQFSHRSGQPQSWMGKGSNINSNSPTPTVITATKHLSINLSQRNKAASSSSTGSQNQNPPGYASSRRLVEVSGSAPTRRPITQVAGALQDSWPNSNTHHHLSPVMKNQKPNTPNNRNYNIYDQSESSSNNYASQVRIFSPIHISAAPKNEFNENPVERKLSLGGREKLVSNTLNTLAKLSPKKPIFVYMRLEGIAAINAGAEAGDVIKKLAGGSKLPFYNGTKSLPQENMPQVFLAPEDMPPPPTYGKIPIPNLKPKEATTPKPTFTKILLPGGTKMTSQLSTQPRTTTTTTTTPSPPPPPLPPQPPQFPFVQSTVQPVFHPSYMQMNTSGFSNQPLSLDQRIKILQMFQQQNQERAHLYQQQQPLPTPLLPPPSPTPLHPDILRGVLPQGAILESITPMGGEGQAPVQGDISKFSQYPVVEPSSNYIQNPPHEPSRGPPGAQQDRNIKDILGSIIETAVSKTVGEMLPAMQQQQQQQRQNQQLQQQNQQQQQQQNQQQQQQRQNQQLQQQNQQQQQQQNQQQQQQRQNQQLQQQNQQQQHNIQQQQLQHQMQQQQQQLQHQQHFLQQQQQQPARLGQAQSREQIQHPYFIQQAISHSLPQFAQQPQPQPQHFAQNPASQMQVQMINGQPMLVPSQSQWMQMQPKMETTGQQPTLVSAQQTQWPQIQQKMENGSPVGQRPRPTGQPLSRNALKSALSFLGIQSTPRPNQGPTGPTQRPFAFQQNPSSPVPSLGSHGQIFQSVTPSPTRMPLFQQQYASRRNDVVGSIETGGDRKPGTVIVQTPDSAKPNGQKSTFVISNGDSNNMPDLKKIMKVLNELHVQQPSPTAPPPNFQPTLAPMINQQHQSPSPTPTSMSPTRRPTTFPYNPTRRPAQQPQVMIRHSSASPTPGPVIISTGRPDGLSRGQIVSSTYSPSGPTTVPHFVSSTARPQNPSSAPIQIIKAISHPDFVQFPQSPRSPMPTPTAPPQQPARQPQIIYSNPTHSVPNNAIIKSIVSTIPSIVGNNVNRPTRPTVAPQRRPQQTTTTRAPPTPSPGQNIIEVDPNLSPEQIQKSIMESIMKHQKETNGGMSNGPIVINADPSMANALGNSPHFMNFQSSEASSTVPTTTPTTTTTTTKASTTTQPSTTSVTTPAPPQPSPTSHIRGSSVEINSGSGSMERINSFNQFSGASKDHHHSKELTDEKTYGKYKSGESGEKNRNNEQSSEERVIEKVITEEKIVWNPGPEGEMTPSRIKTEERIILKPHGIKSNEKKSEEHGVGVAVADEEKMKASFSETRPTVVNKKAFGFKLLNNKEKVVVDTEESIDRSDINVDSSNFAGLLRSKLKFEKMKQKLYPKKTVVEEPAINPFSRYLNPSSRPTVASTTQPQTTQPQTTQPQTTQPHTSSLPDPTTSAQSLEQTPTVDNGRFKIRPGDISLNKVPESIVPPEPVYGITATGQPILLQPTSPTFAASPSALAPIGPSAFPHSPYFNVSPTAVPSIGPSVSPQPQSQTFMASPSASPTPPATLPSVGPSMFPQFPPTAKTPSSIFPSIGPSMFPYPPTSKASQTITFPSIGPSPLSALSFGSYIGPSPTSYPAVQQTSTYPTTKPTARPEINTIPPGTKEEKLIFIPALMDPHPSPTLVSSSSTFQTKNDQNQTVVFTTMNQLPDLMSQLSGQKTEVRMIDDLKSFQATLAKVQETQSSSTVPPPMQTTITTRASTTTTPTPIPSQNADRRMDNYETPFTWRPNGTAPSPTLESLLRQRFPSGLGANVLHAVAAGFAANNANKWSQNVQQHQQQQQQQQQRQSQQPQLIYTMANGVPVAINPGYQPILLQGTKEPILAYYGYNWNAPNVNGAAAVSGEAKTVIKPTEVTISGESTTEPKYTSRFRGPISPEETESQKQLQKEKVVANKKESTTRDPIDPVSEEYEEMTEIKKGKSNHKTQPHENDEEESRKSFKRRRPGALSEESNVEQREHISEEKKASATKIQSTKLPPTTPNVLSKRIDESEEHLVLVDEKPEKAVQVRKEMFVNSGEKTAEEIAPTAKLPILLAPSIISGKSVVSQTGGSFNENKISPKPTAAAVAATQTTTTTTQQQRLTSAVNKLLSTITPTQPTTPGQEMDGDAELRETQEQLKNLLKKLQQKLGTRDDVYDVYDYYDDIQAVASTKAATTTTTTPKSTTTTTTTPKSITTTKTTPKSITTTKTTKKPAKSTSSKSKSKSSKKTDKKKSKSKNKKKSKKSKNKKNKTTTTTTTAKPTTKSTTTSPPPKISTSSTTTVLTTTTTTPPTIIMNHQRHPVSSIETFTSSPTVATTTIANVQYYQPSSDLLRNHHQYETSEEPLPTGSSSSSTEVPTEVAATKDSYPNESSNVAFVYPQATGQKDTAAAHIHHRRRPLWVRRKNGGGSTEGLEPVGQPPANNKVIRLIRRKRPGLRRRPVFVPQSVEVDSSSSPQQQQSTEPAIVTTSSSTTTMPIDVLFETNNAIAKRVGYPDSVEGSQQTSPRAGGKRKLKLIRLKGQRAQWRLKMNDDQEQNQSFGADSSPQAERLVSPVDPNQQLPLMSPLSTIPEATQGTLQITEVLDGRQSRQETSTSIETKVCVRGKCEIVSKN